MEVLSATYDNELMANDDIMTTSKFNLVKNLPKQSQKLERMTSVDSCKQIIEQYNISQAGSTKELENDRQRNICSRRLSKASYSKNNTDTFSQDGTVHSQNPIRKTVILLETPADNKKTSDAPVFTDKG